MYRVDVRQLAADVMGRLTRAEGDDSWAGVSAIARSREKGGRSEGYRVDVDGWTFFVLDVTLTGRGELFLIETNGSNALGTSIGTGTDRVRAEHMFKTFEATRQSCRKGVALLPYQRGFLLAAEFFVGRAGIFAELIQAQQDTWIRSWDEELGDEEISIVCGPIDELAGRIQYQEGRLLYRHRPVVFATNPNLMPELARRGVVRRSGRWYDCATDWFHEGRCAPVIHARDLQQELGGIAGMTPLVNRAVYGVGEFTSVVRSFHDRGLVAVAKMNAGSGGAGIEFFPPRLGVDEIEQRRYRLIEGARAKYGADIEETLYPIQICEFVESSHVSLADGGHLWEMRVECLVRPGLCETVPCSIRLCPEPFDGNSFDRGQVMAHSAPNASTLKFMRSPFDTSIRGLIGIDASKMKTIMATCARWCEAAWRYSSRA